MTSPASDSGTTAATVPGPRPDRPFVPGPAGRLLAGVYKAVVERRNARFDAGRGVITFDRPVISVGNLSLGGTGKTPMVARIVGLLREHGRDPCVAMRGYGSGRGAGGRSDEAELYRAAFDDLPVVAQPNRVEGLLKLFNSDRGERVDCVVLDDGFQHRRIARQLDLLLLDAAHDVFSSGIFPAGRLREPVANAARATHVVVTHAEMIGSAALRGFLTRVGEIAPRAARAVAAHRWSGLIVEKAGSLREEPVSWLRGRRVVVACAIARPASFLGAVERAGANVTDTFLLPDHHPFDDRAFRRIADAARNAGAEAIVVTEKDWTKLARRAGAEWPGAAVRPRLALDFREGWERLERDVLAAAALSPD